MDQAKSLEFKFVEYSSLNTCVSAEAEPLNPESF